ncbi:hypothetical protein [Bacillus sp. NEB1478]|uniref:hypothetical protein n=1 Tax=Bacillus sp. NEB1478 TaxID=3073816 RepID=UPI002873A776|nr:hypothetical protein [Bacillus sp. NEB1478]WNB92880.1 hypothetical protein RGB74_04185 [Bacillus sp. NEB1478]
MEDPLKQLPEILNHGRLKSITFKEEHRQQVLQKARDLHRPPAPKSWFYHWFHQSLSLALGVACIIIFVQFIQDFPKTSNKDIEKAAEEALEVPYANHAILTKVRHDMRLQHNIQSTVASQSGDTLTVYLVYPDDLSANEQFALTKTYLKEVSHLTLNEPYGAQSYLGELWNYVNVKVYTTTSNDQSLAARLNIALNYDWVGTIDSQNGKLKWEKISDDVPYEKGILN